jgi:multidrug efflux pump subunit AcrB
MDGSLGEFMRRFVPAALAALVVSLCVVFLPASPVLAASVFVETNPSTARAGDEVGVRASCTDNLKAATVTAGPIGKVTVSPRYGFLTTTAKVPADTRAGDYTVSLKCPDGKTAKSTLHIVAKVEPVRGPATGGGGTSPGRYAPALIGGGVTAIAAGLFLAVFSGRRRRLG